VGKPALLCKSRNTGHGRLGIARRSLAWLFGLTGRVWGDIGWLWSGWNAQAIARHWSGDWSGQFVSCGAKAITKIERWALEARQSHRTNWPFQPLAAPCAALNCQTIEPHQWACRCHRRVKTRHWLAPQMSFSLSGWTRQICDL
jgi:hypothetical protein